MVIVGGIARRWNAWKWPDGAGRGFSPSYRRVRDALAPEPVRRWGGWWGWLVGHFGPGALRSLGYRAWHRTDNRIKDIAAVSLGWCNFSPWRAGLKRGRMGPAYSHWRCRYRRHSAGTAHRFINYTWGDDGIADYDPAPVVLLLPDGAESPGMPRWLRDRAPTARLREQRMWNRIMRAETTRVRARVLADYDRAL